MTDAASESPDLVIDAATLTGAARTALGPEVPAVFSSCDGIDYGYIPGATAVLSREMWIHHGP